MMEIIRSLLFYAVRKGGVMRWLLVLLIVAFIAAPVWADSCSPATCTPTPEVFIAWTLPAYTNDQGTPVPEQDVVFGYRFDAGDTAIALLSAMLLISLWAMGLIVLLLLKRGNNNAGGA